MSIARIYIKPICGRYTGGIPVLPVAWGVRGNYYATLPKKKKLIGTTTTPFAAHPATGRAIRALRPRVPRTCTIHFHSRGFKGAINRHIQPRLTYSACGNRKGGTCNVATGNDRPPTFPELLPHPACLRTTVYSLLTIGHEAMKPGCR
jgi:hypothetical protein